MVSITLPDGSVRSFERSVTGTELASSIGAGLARAALALKVDGKLKDLAGAIDHDARVEIITAKSADAPTWMSMRPRQAKSTWAWSCECTVCSPLYERMLSRGSTGAGWSDMDQV